jgi:hypothetical protein
MSGWVYFMRRAVAAGVMIALCATVLGCETPYSRAYGRSHADHVAATTANPEAGAEDLEAPHPDGTSADSAIYKMRTREAEDIQEEPPSVIDIDIGN